MRETTFEVDIKNEQTGEQLFSGSFVADVPKRNERASLQFKMAHAAKKVEEDPTEYIDLTWMVVEKYLKSIAVKAGDPENGETVDITSVEDLEYIDAELLISLISQKVVAGLKLGKKNA